MKKELISLLGLLLFISCSSSDEDVVLNTKERLNEYPEITIIPQTNSNIILSEYKDLINNKKGILKTEKEDKNTYSIKIEENKDVELKVQLISEEFKNGSEFYYLRKDGSKLAKGKMLLNKNIIEVEILRYYPLIQARGWWGETKSCFEDTMGSTHGITGGAVVSFLGPAAFATYLGGVGVACAIQEY